MSESSIPPSELPTQDDHPIPDPPSEAEKFAAIVANLLATTLEPYLRENLELRKKVVQLEARLERVERRVFGEAAE